MKFSVLLGCVVAMMPLSIEGQRWGSWGQWTSCSKTCGGGMRVRKKECDHPQNKCETETEACNYQACNATGLSGLNATSGPLEAKNVTVESNPSEGFNTTSDTSPSSDTVGPTSTVQGKGFNETSGTPPSDTVRPTPTEGFKSRSNGPTTVATTDGDITVEVVSTKPPQDVETDEFVGSGTMARKWSDEFGKPTSQKYKELKNECEPKLRETFKGEEGVIATEVTRFTRGSVVVHFRVKTLRSRRTSSSRLQSMFALSVQSGPMKDLGISSFKLSRMTQPNEGPHVEGESNNDNVFEDSWKFFLYGFGAMIALAIIFVLLAVTKIKLVPKDKDELEEESPGFERKFSFPGKERTSELEDIKES